MKTRIILGDTHGHWKPIKDIYDNVKPDEVILLGDYCDSFQLTSQDIATCWNNIQKLKKKHKGLFYLIMGNHDWHYICGTEKYSGYKQGTWNVMHDVLSKAWDNKDIHIAYVDSINKTIYTHAGITNTWLNEWSNPPLDMLDEVNEYGLNFSRISFDMYGDSKWQGPLWVRPSALVSDIYKDANDEAWTQIVGHTRTRNGKPILTAKDGTNSYDNPDNAILWVIDAMPFYYVKETLDDNGKLIKRELISNAEVISSFIQ